MNAPPPDDDRPKKTPLQVDLYGLKGKVTPRPDDEPPPQSWREVARRVNYHLMRFCADTPGLLADVAAGLRAVVRGIARLPGAISERIGRAHDRVDRVLERAPVVQQVAAAPVAALPPAPVTAEPIDDDPLDDLRREVDELRAAGVPVSLCRLPGGQWIAVLAEPELERAALAAGEKAIAGRELDLQLPSAPPPRALGGGTPLDGSGLPKKAVRALADAGYRHFEQVAEAGPVDVAAVKGIGPAYFEEIRQALSDRGMGWSE